MTEFSKSTGDFKSLSSVDLQVLALTYMMEVEKCGKAHIHAVPQHGSQATSSLAGGWYVPEPCRYGQRCTRSNCWYSHLEPSTAAKPETTHCTSGAQKTRVKPSMSAAVPKTQLPVKGTVDQATDQPVKKAPAVWGGGGTDAGWITPDNYKAAQKSIRTHEVGIFVS